MGKSLRKFVAITLIISMCFCGKTTAFAADNINVVAVDTERASSINWWEIGWIILSDYVERLINLDGQSVKDNNWAYLVSPSVEYNTGDMGPELYFRPQVNNSVGTIRMHGHRVIFVDIFSQLALILSDASGDTVSQATTGTNQYMFYTKSSSDVSGRWKAQFISTQTYKWQLYYAHYYNANSSATLPLVEDNFYFGSNNRVYQFSDNNWVNARTVAPDVLNMTQLNDQFMNLADGMTVDYLKDFSAGDAITFSDTIVDIVYNNTENATTFYFMENTSGEKIGWKFDGNLTDEYSSGDVLSLQFEVLNVAKYQDITFESLDYFEAAYSHEPGKPYPNILDYQSSSNAN